jgi:GNAT superfamily N-acetyltransferase
MKIRSAICTVDLAVSRMLAQAFEHDALVEYVLPDRYDRKMRLEHVYRLYLQVFTRLGKVVATDELDAAALWLPPHHYPLTVFQNLCLLPRIACAFGKHTGRALKAMSVVEQACPPRGDFWYLGVLGVSPHRQGRGIGSGLLQKGLAECDRSHLGAYLETVSESTVSLYQRHGFKLRSELKISAGPKIWTMWREPQR